MLTIVTYMVLVKLHRARRRLSHQQRRSAYGVRQVRFLNSLVGEAALEALERTSASNAMKSAYGSPEWRQRVGSSRSRRMAQFGRDRSLVALSVLMSSRSPRSMINGPLTR
jgi:hypothetical protein